MIKEALLLRQAYLASIKGDVSVEQVEKGLKSFLEEGEINDVITAYMGVPPEADAVQWWDNANPWLPLFMWWTADLLSRAGL